MLMPSSTSQAIRPPPDDGGGRAAPKAKISAILGVSFATYDEHERFYQELAKEAGLQPWELDRLLYHFNVPILAELG